MMSWVVGSREIALQSSRPIRIGGSCGSSGLVESAVIIMGRTGRIGGSGCCITAGGILSGMMSILVLMVAPIYRCCKLVKGCRLRQLICIDSGCIGTGSSGCSSRASGWRGGILVVVVVTLKGWRPKWSRQASLTQWNWWGCCVWKKSFCLLFSWKFLWECQR